MKTWIILAFIIGVISGSLPAIFVYKILNERIDYVDTDVKIRTRAAFSESSKSKKYDELTVDRLFVREFIKAGSDKHEGWTIIVPGLIGIGEVGKEKISRVSIGKHSESCWGVSVSDEAGISRAVLGQSSLTKKNIGGTEITPESTLVMFSKDGTVIQKYPSGYLTGGE